MQKIKTVIALFLLLTFATSIIATMPTTKAQPPTVTMKTYPFVDAVPNPVGVGEQVLIRLGILQALGSAEYGWTGITVTVTKPDGQNETLGPFTTDSTGGTASIYVPNQVGTYKFTTNFPQQTNPSTFFDLERGTMIFEGTIMQASTSDTVELIVRQEPSQFFPGQPLPTEFWSRPVDAQLREWYSISGNWVARPDNSWAFYNEYAPETAHVLWAKPLTTGGLVGGLWGPGQVPVSAETGDAYAGKFTDSVIMNGVLYYNRDEAKVGSNGITAVDLRTGKELWFRNNTILSFGQIFYFDSFNYDGVFDYLWDASAGTTWNAYDPFTGEWIYRMVNVPSGTRTYGPSGEILIYQINYANRWLALWNSTAAGQTSPGFTDIASYGSWGAYFGGGLVHGRTINASDPRSYSWNVTIPAGLTAGSSFFTPILKVYPDRVMSIDFNQTRVRVWAVSTAPANRGTLLFDKTWPAPAEWLQGSNTLHYVGATNQAEDGVIAVWSKELRKHYGFSTQTGDFLWETASEHWLDAYGWGNVEHTWYFAYDKLYSVGVAGIVYAYDLKTGNTLWTYEMSDPYSEPVTGNNWWGWIMLIADNKIYVGTVEHSAEMPLPRGGPFICLDAETGSEIFRVNGMFRGTRWGGNAIIGDSIIATMDTYDQRIYAVGRGPSQTTVSASPAVAPMNNGVMIQGYVTDISAGTKSDELVARFPNGVPAVSDASMSQWMLYVYKQFLKPTNVTGVEVSIDVLDANGNYRNIGTTTADANGFFSFDWMPDIEGKYTVYASFAGSKAYYGSFAQAAFAVTEAQATPGATPTGPTSLTDQYFIAAVAAIIAVVIIIGVILMLMVRKRP